MDFHLTAKPTLFAIREIRIHACFDLALPSHLVNA
ncbi:UNVERIFIED_ORG: hypothetical protein J2W85_000742 [Ensifer adhaerens]|nr:hypothetical protein [Ensifer adhaerens]